VELKPPTLFELLSTYKTILDRQAKLASHTVKLPEVSLEERIKHVLSYLQDRHSVLFEELCQDIPLKIYLVVTLLAVLELIRRGQVGLEQKYEFGSISLWRIRN
jgi:segregation and condensation protein A